MLILDRFAPMAEELDTYFTSFDPQEAFIRGEIEPMIAAMEDAPVLMQKAAIITKIAEVTDLAVFRHFPLYAQIAAARPRFSWGGLYSPNGAMYLHNHRGGKLLQEYNDFLADDRSAGYLHNWNNPVGNDHHALNYDTILTKGLDGLRAEALRFRETADEDKRTFYDAAITSLDALAGLARRFSNEAARMLEAETDPAVRKNLARIADTAARIPMQPAETFYEALAAIFFCRECVGTLDGIGISTYGHLDRLLAPYYERDLAAGRITPDEAGDLLAALFVWTAVRFNENAAPGETSTTIILGGCDADGNVVYNDVTRLILKTELELRCVNLKLDCRISKAHPAQYIEDLCAVQAAGLAVMVFMNDDVHIAARVRRGQDIRDARLYVAGGCHEIVLGGTEVCTRADTWIGLPRILLDTLKKREYADFEELLQEAIADVRAYHIRIENAKNKVEVHWSEINPMPLYSTMLTGCLESGRDCTAGGVKYASTALSMVAPATFIDSLYSVKTLCFDEKKLTLSELTAILDDNFEGQEPLRQYIINRIPKYGSGNAEVDAFSARVMAMLSEVSGRENGRGGRYYPAFYPHQAFQVLGGRTGATPDGRKHGFPLSRGCSPSEFLTGITPGDMLESARTIDFTGFTDSTALEMTLPRLGDAAAAILPAIVAQFLENGGSTLQFNMLDREMLLEAQREPEKHRDIIVRVCGYSYYFIYLRRDIQDEIIARALRE